MEKIQKTGTRIKESFHKNFRYATWNFIFIIAFVQVFQMVFGMENSIVGVIFTIMMSASMMRDLTATPLRHLCIQTVVFFLMTMAACFVANTKPLLAFPIHVATIFLILYVFTYEYSNHLYFPYILSYLFLIFISPVSPAQLPKRLLGVFAGTVCIMVYQWANGRNRAVETARDVLASMLGRAQECIDCLLSACGIPENPEQLRADLCKLSKMVYDRRKRALCISDAGFAMIDCGHGLEHLVLLLYEMEGPITAQRAAMLRCISSQLSYAETFLLQKEGEMPSFCRTDFGPPDSAEAEQFYQCLAYIRSHMLNIAGAQKQKKYPKTLSSLSVRLKAALRVSPVRVVYAARVSLLLGLCTLVVQGMGLPHGKWLLFTVASVSLPYADDVGAKAKKRMIATLTGSLCSVLLFSLIPSSAGRTFIMLLSGYLTFYFSDYSTTFACSTIGALGGAVFMNCMGWGPVGQMGLIRLGYVALGIGVALLANCAIFPFKRSTATSHLWKKYRSTTELLIKICKRREVDSQLYYGLVIQTHLLEDKLIQNAKALNWEGTKELLEECRKAVRDAHTKMQYCPVVE